MRVNDLITYLQTQFTTTKFYNGTINKTDKQCIGVFLGQKEGAILPLGGVGNSTFNILPIKIMVHWTANADTCEQMAQSVYDKLLSAQNVTVGSEKIFRFEMLDCGPISINRDEGNICEMIIRTNIYYER
jgi:hypothetical protein